MTDFITLLMKFAALIAWLWFAPVLFGQGNVLPYVNNGKWSLIDTNGRTIVATPFSYIHAFDQAGYSFYAHNGAYGIINSKGEVVEKARYADVQQKGHGHYQLLTDRGWIAYAPGDLRLVGNDTIHTFETLSGSWALTGTSNTWYLEHLTTGKRWEVADSSISYRVLNDHILLEINDTNQLLIDPQGTVVLAGTVRFREQNNVYDARSGKQHYLFGVAGKWPFTPSSDVEFESDALFIPTAREGLYVRYDGSVIFRGNYTYIGHFNSRYLEVQRNGLCALVDRTTRQPALPFRYESIVKAGTNYEVQLGNNTGLLDAQFREIVPCNYQRIVLRGDKAQVYDLSYVGLYSIRRKKELLPPVYHTIKEQNNRFKASRNEFITIIEIDQEHNVLKTAKIDNTLTVHSPGGQAAVRRGKFIDPRLFALGWFLDSTLIQPPKNEPAYYAYKWGLRDANDSVVITASIPELRYVPQAPFTMQYTGKRDYEKQYKLSLFKPVYLPTGKILSKYTLFDYDSTDFTRRHFMRVSSENGFGIFRADGSYSDYAFLEKGANKYLLYCRSETINPLEKRTDTEEKTEVTSLSFSGRRIPHPAAFRLNNPTLCIGLAYPDAVWNYLDPEGLPLFRDSFAFAHPFLGNQAIVKKGQKWGAVNSDTLFIPAIYDRVERLLMPADTFFLVRKSTGGIRLLDSLSRPVDFSGRKLVAYKNNTLIAEGLEGKQLLDAQLQPLSESYPVMKYLKNGLILAKNRKQITLLSPAGEVLYSGEEEPEVAASGNFLLFPKGNQYAVFDAAMQPVVDGCSGISASRYHLIATKAGEHYLFNASGQQVIKPTDGLLLEDTITGNVLLWHNGKATLYANDQKQRRFGLERPAVFYNNRIFVSNRDSCAVFSLSGELLETLPALVALEPVGYGNVLLKTAAKVNLFYNDSWQRMLPEEVRFRRMECLAPTIYAYQSTDGKTIFYHTDTRQSDTTNYTTGYGTFTNGRLLVKTGGRYCYVDESLRRVGGCTYRDAVPFSGNFAAVGDQRGWTVIDRNCNPVVYPGSGKITVVANDLFSTPQPALCGVYNTSGKLIIPVVFEEIRLLSNGLFLAIRDGAFTYFRRDGSQIHVP